MPESYVTDEHFAAIVTNGDLDANKGVVSGKVYDGYGLQVRCVYGGRYRVTCTVIRL